ncbi:unnamed protein product, partial [Phaeothamnion confervicola]
AVSHRRSVARYWKRVDETIAAGAPSAAGACSRSTLVRLPAERIDGIYGRLAFPQRSRSFRGVSLRRKAAMVAAASASAARTVTTAAHVATVSAETRMTAAAMDMAQRVAGMLAEVETDFVRAVARAMVHYELRDPQAARTLGIDPAHLMAGPAWYAEDTYRRPEWRLLRQTGVSRRRRHRAAAALARKLCCADALMLELERLWHEGSAGGDTAAIAGAVAHVEAGRNGGGGGCGGGGGADCTYATALLTDVATAHFRRTLPMSLDNFCAHLERRANEVREALREFWLGDAAGVIGRHTAE